MYLRKLLMDWFCEKKFRQKSYPSKRGDTRVLCSRDFHIMRRKFLRLHALEKLLQL